MTVAAFEAVGAKPTPMALAEVFTSLQQGTIEGQENPLAMIQNSSFYEVQDYVIRTEHLRAWVYKMCIRDSIIIALGIGAVRVYIHVVV